MSVCSNVDVNPTSPGRIAIRSGFSQKPNDLLQGLHILVLEDRCYHFAFLRIGSCDAHIPLEFPNPALLVFASPSVVSVLACCVPGGRSEKLCNLLRCVLPGDVVHLDFYAYRLFFHLGDLGFNFAVHFYPPSGLLPSSFCCVYINSKTHIYPVIFGR